MNERRVSRKATRRQTIAEQQLLESLKVPRVSQAKIQSSMSSIKKVTLDINNLKKYRRVDNQIHRISPEEALFAQVRELHHQNLPSPVPANAYQKIKSNTLVKRDRHDFAHKQYHQRVLDISEQLEKEILESSDQLKHQLAEVDAERRAKFAQLRNDSFMVDKPHSLVAEFWTQLQALCQKRTQVVQNFEDALEACEQQRAKLVGVELHSLTNTFVQTASMLPNEVERVIEREAYELNLVLIANRTTHADLLARIRQADVIFFVETRTDWEVCEANWRELRHNDAISTFHKTINSSAFKDPEERRDVCKKMQQEDHERQDSQRLPLLERIQEMANLEKLCSADITAVKAEFEDLHATVEERNAFYFKTLRGVHDDKMTEAANLREALRRSLHTFGAKAPEGQILECQSQLAAAVSSPAMEEYFRVNRSLKSELLSIHDKLGSPDLIYPAVLEALSPKVELLVSALDFDARLEKQGKASDRKAVLATVDKLNKVSRTEWPSLTTTLLQQIQTLVNIQDLDPLFCEELHAVSMILEEGMEFVSKTKTSAGSTASAPSSEPGDNMSATSPSPEQPSSQLTSPTPESRTKGGASPGTRLGASTAGGLDYHAIKRGFRRVGLMLTATDLSDDIKIGLPKIVEQLQTQAIANSVIDQVIAAECTDILTKREREGVLVLDKIGQHLETQSTRLHEICTRMCDYYASIAKLQENHLRTTDMIELEATKLLYALEDAFDAENDEREEFFRKSQSNLRHAPDQRELQASFETCLASLDKIEFGYRQYYKKGTLAAKNHPKAVELQQNRYTKDLLNKFGLRELSQMKPLHPETEQEEDTAALIKTLLSKDTIDGAIDIRESAEEEKVEVDEQNPQEENTAEPVAISPPPRKQTLKKQSLKPEAVAIEVPKFTSEAGTEFAISQPLDDLITDIINPAISNEVEDEDENEDEPNDEDDYDDLPPEAQLSVDETTPPEEEEHEEVSEEELRRQQQLEAERLAQEQLAREEDEEAQAIIKVNVPIVEISNAELNKMVDVLRNHLIDKQCNSRVKALAEAGAKEATRTQEYTLELEERLRQHWPRKGRLDVLMYQPREGELISHRQRHDRHSRLIQQKLTRQQQAFKSEIAKTSELIEKYALQQQSLRAQLAMQNSLAALQGIEMRFKQNQAELKTQLKQQETVLSSYLHEEPTHLVNLCNEIIQQCKHQLFPELETCEVISGCDYHPKELELLKEELATLNTEIQDVVLTREHELDKLQAQQHQAFEMFEGFKKRYESCLQNLSMKDGLGQKYGAPRRNAQEKLRSEIARSDTESAAIQNLLKDLMTLAAQEKVSSTKASTVGKQIRQTLLRIRHQIYHRMSYLEFWKKTPAGELPLLLTSIPADEVHVEADAETEEVDECHPTKWLATTREDADPVLEDPLTSLTFLQVVQEIDTTCREETRALFQREGKEHELPPDGGVPESLEVYLQEQQTRAEQLRIQHAHTLRQQIIELENLLALCPRACLKSLTQDYQTHAEKLAKVIQTQFHEQYDALENRKQYHRSQLRPELCSPNQTAQVEALSQSEVERSTQVQELIQQAQAQLLRIHQLHAKYFEVTFVHVFAALMVILDSCVMEIDTGVLPGDENRIPKRKSLKRLRKAKRKELHGDPRVVDDASDAGQRLTKRQWAAIPDIGQLQMKKNEEEAPSIPDGACVSYLTHAHRACVQARDQLYIEFCEMSRKTIDAIDSEFTDLLSKETLWMSNWEHDIQALRNEE